MMLLFAALLLGALPPAAGPNLYDADPNHIWNRLYKTLCVREDQAGNLYGVDALDLLLWDRTTHLLIGSSHQRALSILDEFLQTHAENRIRDPLKRALLQRNLWAVFDWSATRLWQYPTQSRELQIRLAEVMRRLALTPRELASLPENYSAALSAVTFASAYDTANRTRPFLPADLLDPHGSWVRLNPNSDFSAPLHVSNCSARSTFIVFLRLPGGRKATIDYLQTLWSFPEPFVAGIDAEDHGDNFRLPQFPAGTQVALLRQMNLFASDGAVVSTPITESLQIRAFRAITARRDRNNIGLDWPAARDEQDFFEVRLSQAELFANHAGGLQPVARDTAEFATFETQGRDPFDETNPVEPPTVPVLVRCVMCHSAPGIHSVQSRGQLLKPNRAQPAEDNHWGRWWENGDAAAYKSQRFDWGLLMGLSQPSVKGAR